MKKNKLKNLAKAFTLMELSIVLLIIGILTTSFFGAHKLVQLSRLSSARQVTSSASFVVKKSLILWLEPTLDESFNNLSNGDSVDEWKNLADEGLSPSQGASGNQPTFVMDGINDIPTVRFDGTGDYLEFADDSISFMNPSQFTIFIVSKVSGGAGSWRSSFSSRSSSGGYNTYVHNGDKWTFANAANVLYSTTDATLNVPKVFIVDYDGSSSSAYVNNTSEDTENYSFTRNTEHPARVGAGRTESTPTYFWNGDISEIIMYNKKLSDTEREEVYDYLAEKYKIN